MYCKQCGAEIDDDARFCPDCGQKQYVNDQNRTIQCEEESLIKKGWFLAIMCYFFGVFGVHRFLVGKVGTGILYACTAGLLGIGILVDLIMILTSSFTDSEGNRIPLGL